MTRKTRIGILQTDSVLEEFRPEFGDYPAMFTALLESAAAEKSAADNSAADNSAADNSAADNSAATGEALVLDIHTYRVAEGEFPAGADACDGYVITGSRHSVYDELPWIAELGEFLRQVLSADARVVGICFGHQLLAHFFGGRTEPAAEGWGVGVHEVQVVEPRSWMQPPATQLRLLSSHKDQVSQLPQGAELIAASDFCPLAGFVLGERAMTLQGHPEFSKSYAAALMNKRRELLGETVYSEGIESLQRPTDGNVVGHWMLNFLLGR
jgi:GMP synthase-like glutamine amidotransferase